MYLDIQRNHEISITRQIYEGIRKNIHKGTLVPDVKLPSTRSMAEVNNVSRMVVLDAYEQLIAEGYLYTKSGSGTYVNAVDFLEESPYNQVTVQQEQSMVLGLRHEDEGYLVDFRTGAPDLSLFPLQKWGMIYRQVCQDLPMTSLDYYNAGGSQILCRAILTYLNRARGIVADPDQVVITTGAAQGFTLLARMLLTNKDTVVVEDPINQDIYKMLTATGASIVSSKVDDWGISTDGLESISNLRLVFTTPSHQYPMGSILSINRRMHLIQIAEKTNGYIIEDDYDSAFRFQGNPVSALHTLAPDRVIYTGTFSKILFPALRMGYTILPKSIVKAFKLQKHLEDLHTPILEQLTLAKFIEEGHLERHIHKCRKIYHSKNTLLRKVLTEAFGNEMTIVGDSAGIHLVVKFHYRQWREIDYVSLRKLGVNISRVSDHSMYPESYDHYLMLGYGHLTEDEVIKGVHMIKAYTMD